MYKALLVDDEALTREAISENIPWEKLGFELIASCENGRDAMERMKQAPPDLLLTDICMPYVDGIELARYVHENHPDTKTVIISGYDEFGSIRVYFKAHYTHRAYRGSLSGEGKSG